MQCIAWVTRISCFLGLACGVLLLAAPDKMKRIEKQLNFLFETKPMVAKLDRSSYNMDAFIFRHPFIVGLTGAMLSFFLILLSIANLLR
jgi:hypothetical protein